MVVLDRVKAAWSGLTGSANINSPVESLPVRVEHYPEPKAYSNIFTVSYTGEKNLGEMGPVIDYNPDYQVLRYRSWQSYLEHDITQTIIKKFATWVVGSGLKLQAEPERNVLKSEKINLGPKDFNDVAEARFNVYAKSKSADYSGMRSLHKLAKRAFYEATIGGDVLVILRYISGVVKVQLVDGANLTSPMLGSSHFVAATEKGNKIRHGVEVSPTGEHVAFYVKKGLFEVERVPAKMPGTDLKVAFLIYGLEYRLDGTRGMPLIAAVLETIKKLERYKEATVGSAEERQKIAYTIEHGIASTGESPLSKNLAKAFNAEANLDIPEDVRGNKMADTIAASTNKQVFNLPIDSKLQSLDSKNELYFKDFYSINGEYVCSAIQIPPEVAMSKYNSNFSASRAALKDWEHTVLVNRGEGPFEFYSNVYYFWLYTEVLKNKIEAPGYLKAVEEENTMVLGAYRNCRFVGASIPHIDPLKEVNAERAKLGETAKSIPLTTVEAATEALNGGDSDQNMEQYSTEYAYAKDLGLVSSAKVTPPKN